MPHNLAEVQDLDYWLRYISSVHPRDIELGLDRIRLVANNLGIEKLCLLYTSPSPRDRG